MNGNICQGFGTKKQIELLKNIFENAKTRGWNIVRVLQEVQKVYGFLPKQVIEKTAEMMNIPISEIFSIITFYAEFSLVPKGKFPISVCLGTACYVNGAGLIFDKICALLGISEGQTTMDGRFSIDQTRCVGCCGMAPVLSIGEDIYGNVKLEEVEKILKKYMEQ